MGVLKYEMNNEQLLFCDEMKILNLAMLKFSVSFSHDLVLDMEVVEEGIWNVTEGYIHDLSANISGVPQGTELGLEFFTLHISEIAKVVEGCISDLSTDISGVPES